MLPVLMHNIRSGTHGCNKLYMVLTLCQFIKIPLLLSLRSLSSAPPTRVHLKAAVGQVVTLNWPLGVNVNGHLSLCISSVIDCQPIQGAFSPPCHLELDKWKKWMNR